MNILCLPSEKGEYCIFAKLNKVSFDKKLNPFENREYCSESANQGFSDSLTHWLRDSGFFLNHFKIQFCLDVLIVLFVITFFFSGFVMIKEYRKIYLFICLLIETSQSF